MFSELWEKTKNLTKKTVELNICISIFDPAHDSGLEVHIKFVQKRIAMCKLWFLPASGGLGDIRTESAAARLQSAEAGVRTSGLKCEYLEH